MLAGNLTDSELSSFLRRAQDRWWQAMLNKDYAKAAFISNDMEAAVNRICNLTHKKLEEATR